MLHERLAKEWYPWLRGRRGYRSLAKSATVARHERGALSTLAVGAGWCPRPLLNEIGAYLRAFLCHGASISAATFCRILEEQRSLRCGSGGGCGRVRGYRSYLQMCETMSPHRTNDQDRDALLGRFRVALHTVERSPSDEAFAELRLAAAPIIDRLERSIGLPDIRTAMGPRCSAGFVLNWRTANRLPRREQ